MLQIILQILLCVIMYDIRQFIFCKRTFILLLLIIPTTHITQRPFSVLMTIVFVYAYTIWRKPFKVIRFFFLNVLIRSETHLYPLHYSRYIIYVGWLLWSCSGNVCKTILSTVNGLDFASVAEIPCLITSLNSSRRKRILLTVEKKR